MSIQNQIKQISKTLNFTLLKSGIVGLQRTYADLKPDKFPFGELRTLYNNLGFSSIPLSQLDTDYYFINKDIAEEIAWDIMTLLDKTMYRREYYDCDNFSFLASSLISLFYGINTCGAIWCDIYNNQTGAFVGGHYLNGFATYDKTYKRFELYLFDAINPCFVKVERGKPIIMNSWRIQIKKGTYF